MFKKYFLNFMQLTRMYSLATVLASCIIVLSFAHFHEKFSIINFILLTLALCCLNLFENLYDDFVDIKAQVDKGVKLQDVKFNSFVPKAKLILDGTFSFKQVAVILSVLALIPSLIGIYFIFFAGFPVLIFMALGVVLTLFYPFSSRFYLAEIVVALIYGPLMILGGYYALTGEFNFNLLWVSLAIFFSTTQLLHAHSLMDWEFDVIENRKTLCILSKSKDNSILVLKLMISLAYAIIVLGVLTHNLNPYSLFVFLTLPIATKLFESMKDYINVKQTEYPRRWYYGMFENWKFIAENKIDFFMYRFYLSRNFSLFFALFLAIGTVI